jgi:hypothetical protein
MHPSMAYLLNQTFGPQVTLVEWRGSGEDTYGPP